MAGEIAYKLTAEEKQAVDAIRKVAEAYEKVEGGAKKVNEATRTLQKEQEEMGRAAKRIMDENRTDAEKYADKIKKIEDLFRRGLIPLKDYQRATKRVSDEYHSVGQAAEGAFGVKAIDTLKNYVMGVASITGAISAVTKELKEIDAIRERAAAKARESEFSYGSLAEVSEGSPQQFKKNLAMARGIAAKAGMSEHQAAKLTFALNPDYS